MTRAAARTASTARTSCIHPCGAYSSPYAAMFAAVRTAAQIVVAAPPRTAPAPRRAAVSGPVARSPPTTRTSAEVRLTGLVQPSAAHALGWTNISTMPTIAASTPPSTREGCWTSLGRRGPGTSTGSAATGGGAGASTDAGAGAGVADATGGAERGGAGADAVGTGVAVGALGAGTGSGATSGATPSTTTTTCASPAGPPMVTVPSARPLPGGTTDTSYPPAVSLRRIHGSDSRTVPDRAIGGPATSIRRGLEGLPAGSCPKSS